MERILNIAQVGAPVLRKPTKKLSKEELLSESIQEFIDDLIQTMRTVNGAGLAANQVHQSLRICVIEVNHNPRYPYRPNIPLTVLVNPDLTPISELVFENYEGCLSVPNLRGKVKRYCEIAVQAMDRLGNPISMVVKGMKAATYQHEVDHLDGKLFLDRIEDSKSLVTWNNFERYHQQEVAYRVNKLVEQYGS
jgi:peptide deformylase